jgi:hypothetical protein
MLTLTTPVPRAPIAAYNLRATSIDHNSGLITQTWDLLDAQQNVLASVQVQLGPTQSLALINAFKPSLYAHGQAAQGLTGAGNVT